ncbi:amidohydrolase family protein [Paenibacillus beijingensis]|uniref:Amidohydrolase-related domain-containing protein n=1 Tax=Paenibacillus beijingensis TaxID=1126833 RepID=A0A0D5NPD0_9BACL|nr:amidohydrolase family protein [Paenibacillus beijingensis]AJY76872.1 hypothetical protein VN24_22810 [Paenibacillus beijingensis]
MADLILAHGTVINREGKLLSDRHVLVRDGQILAVNEGPLPAAGKVVDCTGCFITPGLVNLHTHTPMVLFRGFAEDVSINDWFNTRIWPYESRLTPDDVYTGARLAIVEMIENGVTAFADHYFEAGRIADAIIETGIRAELSPTIFGLGEGVEEAIDAAADLIQQRRNENSRLTFRMGPHAPYTCPAPVLQAIVRRAKELGVGVHIHASETSVQVTESLRDQGMTPFEVLAGAGIFDLPVTIAHGLWLEESDLRFLTPDTWFAACPKTYLKLAAGEGNLWNFHDRLNVAIGTDGAASSNTLNPLEQARLWALVGKQTSGRADRFLLEEAWRLLMNGHRAMGLPTGDVSEGYEADLVVWDLQQPNTAPVHNPLAALIYSAESRNVRDVLVQGRFLKQDFRVVSLDAREALAAADHAARLLFNEGPGQAKVTY